MTFLSHQKMRSGEVETLKAISEHTEFLFFIIIDIVFIPQVHVPNYLLR